MRYRLLVSAAVAVVVSAGLWIVYATSGRASPEYSPPATRDTDTPPLAEPDRTETRATAAATNLLATDDGALAGSPAESTLDDPFDWLDKPPAQQIMAAENQAQRRFLLKKLLEESDTLAAFERSGIREAVFEWLATNPQSFASGHQSREVIFDMLTTIFESGKPWAADFALNLALDPKTGDVREEYFANGGLGHNMFRSIYASLFNQGTPEAYEALRDLYATMNEGPNSMWGYPHAAFMVDYAADASAEGSDELFWELYEGLTPNVRSRYLNWFVFNDQNTFSGKHGDVFQELLRGSDPEWRDSALGMLVSFDAQRVQRGAEAPSQNAASLEQLFLEGDPEQQASLLNDVTALIEGRVGGRGTSINPGALDLLLEQAGASSDPAVQQAGETVRQRLDAVTDVHVLVQEVNEVLSALQELKQ